MGKSDNLRSECSAYRHYLKKNTKNSSPCFECSKAAVIFMLNDARKAEERYFCSSYVKCGRA